MTISGSDSGGGAGIQADLKTFAALGVYGTSVITAITAQNTVRVMEVMEVPISVIESQFDAIMSDIGTDVIKTGMMSSSTIIETVVRKIEKHGLRSLVVDPIMVTTSGDPLLQKDAVETIRRKLIPLSTVVTPNSHEAGVLVGRPINTLDDARDVAQEIVAMGAKCVVVKGGHIKGPATDILFDGTEFRAFTHARVPTSSTHGTGCTFASAIAACLACELPLRESVSRAKKYVSDAMRQAFPIGNGHGPLNHFHELWNQ